MQEVDQRLWLERLFRLRCYFCCPVRRRATELLAGKGRALFEAVGRVAQPPPEASSAGDPAGAPNRARLLVGYLFLARQEQVTRASGAEHSGHETHYARRLRPATTRPQSRKQQRHDPITTTLSAMPWLEGPSLLPCRPGARRPAAPCPTPPRLPRPEGSAIIRACPANGQAHSI